MSAVHESSAALLDQNPDYIPSQLFQLLTAIHPMAIQNDLNK